MSYLSQQFALPKSLGIAKLALNVMSTLLGGTNIVNRISVYNLVIVMRYPPFITYSFIFSYVP